MQNNFKEAEKILQEGLYLDSTNFDILYNSAYLYYNLKEYKRAYFLYKNSYELCKDNKLKREIESKIKCCENYFTNTKIKKKKVLLGSPIYQKPEILSEFLKSLEELQKKYYELDYFFIDDNTNKQSSNLLEDFKNKYSNGVELQCSYLKDKYICTNFTHSWNENLIWKVANFKNLMINKAKEKDYDYLFLIDSDIIINPNTIDNLIEDNKDIVSNIFWTQWTSNTEELPQVWQMDFYKQYFMKRGEKLSQTELENRKKSFINILRKQGIYEVGGLGACTLISKEAIKKGVNFKEIPNISFWGEDRHFCIRAQALGIKLYVDTIYPAYHIYRSEDLQGINQYKK
ncbi:hypothetical protein C7M60_00850 [Clostridium botulinum]|nr:hypothetical protein C7M60_00850 [Clostridium botulinum]AVQ51251.1 hypothetical protein C7M58_00845 [Clostridium botulinum]